MKTLALNPLLFVLVYVAIIMVSVALIVRFLASTLGQVTSWWRSPFHNQEVGGLPGSAHLIGWAADIVPTDPDTEARARRTFPVVVNEGTHLHVSIFRA